MDAPRSDVRSLVDEHERKLRELERALAAAFDRERDTGAEAPAKTPAEAAIGRPHAEDERGDAARPSGGAPDPSAGEPLAGGDASHVAGQVRQIIDSAQFSAEQIQREVEAEVGRRAAQALSAAEERADQYLRERERSIDALAAERVERLRELSDELIGRAESLRDGFDEAAIVKQQLDGVIEALGRAAEATAASVRWQSVKPDRGAESGDTAREPPSGGRAGEGG